MLIFERISVYPQLYFKVSRAETNIGLWLCCWFWFCHSYLVNDFITKTLFSRGHYLVLGQLHFLISGSGGLRALEFLADIIWAIVGVVE